MRLCLIPYLHTFFFFSLFFGGDSLYRRFILTSATKPIKKTGNGVTIIIQQVLARLINLCISNCNVAFKFNLRSTMHQ